MLPNDQSNSSSNQVPFFVKAKPQGLSASTTIFVKEINALISCLDNHCDVRPAKPVFIVAADSVTDQKAVADKQVSSCKKANHNDGY